MASRVLPVWPFSFLNSKWMYALMKSTILMLCPRTERTKLPPNEHMTSYVFTVTLMNAGNKN